MPFTNLSDLPTEVILLIGNYLPFRLGLPSDALNKTMFAIFQTPDSIATRAITYYASLKESLVYESYRSEPGQHLVIQAIHERLRRYDPSVNVDLCFAYFVMLDVSLTPLEAAAFVGNLESVCALLELGAKPQGDASRLQGFPLFYACEGGRGRLEIARLLLDKGADVIDPHGRALTMCVENGNVELVQLLLNHGAGRNGLIDRALVVAAENSQVYVAKVLVAHGADVPLDLNQALWTAVWAGCLEMVKFLLENGADSEPNTPLKEQALEDAEIFGHVDVLEFLRVH
ncbi:hypothetical protein HDU93_008536 [Gonapodya sp. JEL0774]|nr:hypothetical protein HDU93_008536 [Gonapodya sp. JEL0774]